MAVKLDAKRFGIAGGILYGAAFFVMTVLAAPTVIMRRRTMATTAVMPLEGTCGINGAPKTQNIYKLSV